MNGLSVIPISEKSRRFPGGVRLMKIKQILTKIIAFILNIWGSAKILLKCQISSWKSDWKLGPFRADSSSKKIEFPLGPFHNNYQIGQKLEKFWHELWFVWFKENERGYFCASSRFKRPNSKMRRACAYRRNDFKGSIFFMIFWPFFLHSEIIWIKEIISVPTRSRKWRPL